MEVYQAIKARRSVRDFKEEMIKDSLLEKILDAARLAPSAHNKQDYKIIVIKDAARKKALSKAALNQPSLVRAPVVLAGVALNTTSDKDSDVPFYAANIAIAFDHITLAAVSEGLGTCWVGAFFQEEVREILDVPENCQVITLMPIGIPDDEPIKKKRKELKELVRHERFTK